MITKSDFFFTLALVTSILVLVMVPITVVLAVSEYQTCTNLEQLNPERNFEWRFFGGCMVEVEGVYWPRQQVIYQTLEELR